MRKSESEKAKQRLADDVGNAKVIRRLGGFPLPRPDGSVGKALKRAMKREKEAKRDTENSS